MPVLYVVSIVQSVAIVLLGVGQRLATRTMDAHQQMHALERDRR
ncbi:MAG: hypothetical protein ACRCZP_16320 [Phycicoccus sp.]